VIFGWTGQAEMEAVHRGNNFGLMRTKVALAIAEAADNCGLGIEKFVEATHIRIKQEAMNKVVENWTQKYSISIEASEGWNNALKSTKTWADVVMATSDYANSIENGKKQSEFEEIAGQMLFEGVSKEYTY